MNTIITGNPCADAMRAMALHLLEVLEWRHHGIGVLQGYVKEGGDKEFRLHVWCRQLVKPGINISGDAHDHRFDMTSHVLAGSIEHEEITAIPDPSGYHEMLALTHARAASDTNYHGPTRPLDGFFHVERQWTLIKEGESYRFPSRLFHRSPLSGRMDSVAVTLVEKSNQTTDRARILYPVGEPPVMAFGHDIDPQLISRVMKLAKKALK